MTESTPNEPSMPTDPATPEGKAAPTGKTGETRATAEATGAPGASGSETAEGGPDGKVEGDSYGAAGRRRLVLVLAGVLAAALLVAAAVVFFVRQPTEAKVGECIRETDVVSCGEPHDARIVQIVGNANDCAPPATNVFKEADGRYLCVVDEAG